MSVGSHAYDLGPVPDFGICVMDMSRDNVRIYLFIVELAFLCFVISSTFGRKAPQDTWRPGHGWSLQRDNLRTGERISDRARIQRGCSVTWQTIYGVFSQL